MEMALFQLAQKPAILAMGSEKVHDFTSKRLDFQGNFVY